jgi:predicted RNA binding protein YcfA (HicA-like mRNA interferase family)
MKGEALRTSVSKAMKVRAIIKMLLNDGWIKVGQRGSHRQYRHPIKPGRVTVPGKLSDELRKGTQKSILRQAGLEE